MTLEELFVRLHERPAEQAEATARALRNDPPPVVVSACLLGIACRYDGSAKPVSGLSAGLPGAPMPVCPEVLAGLGTPRPPMTFDSGGEGPPGGVVRLQDRHGRDCTAALGRGVDRALGLVRAAGATHAVLKARSPSCAVRQVHTRQGLVAGVGLFTAACLGAGLIVRSDEQDDWPGGAASVPLALGWGGPTV